MMFNFILTIFRVIFLLFSAMDMDIVIKNAILKKENEILKRKKKERIKFKFFDRLSYAVMCKLSEKAKELMTLIKPETVLKWQRNLIRKFWTLSSYKPIIVKFDVTFKNLPWEYGGTLWCEQL